MMQIINKVRNTIRRYQMLEGGDRVLVCVSGGADSCFLLETLLRLKDEFNVKLFIANLDHGIRGRPSYEDSLFVKRLSKNYRIGLFFKKLNFKKDKKLSIEETARKLRYDFFNSVAKRHRINKIATAHTVDDLAETVLMRIIKGTSLKGIIGIPPKRASSGKIEYIRPLIEIEKKDILKSLKERKIVYRIDETNLETKFFRNSVRNRIIPYLSRYNPRVKRALVNLAENLREDKEFIETQKNKISGMIHQRGQKVSLRIKDIAIQPKTIQKEIARDALIKAGSNIKKLTFRHWKEIYSLIRLKPSGKSLDLPGGIRLTKNSGSLIFSKL